MAEVASLELKVKTNADEAAASLKKLANSMSGVKDACDDYAKGVRKVANALEKLNKQSSEVKTATADMSEAVSEAKETVEPKEVNLGGETVSKKSWIAAIASAAAKAQPALKAISAAAGIAKVAMGKVGKETSVVVNGLRKLAKITGLTGFVDSIKKAAAKMNVLSKQLIRIATYRLIRSALKEISQSFKEGSQNAYLWAKSVGNSFSASMDKATTSILYMKNALGAMIMPLANSLVPILEIVIDKFVELINKANQFFATLTGASTWTKAIKYPKTYASEISSAVKSAKNSLMGFDEINRLDDNDSSSDPTQMFEEVITEGGLGASIREAIENAGWEDLGNLLSAKVNGLVDKVDVKKIITDLCGKLNSIMTAVNSFMEGVSWEGIGQKIADGFNAIAESLDPNQLGELLSQKLNAVVGIIKGFVENFKWGEAGTWLANVVTTWFESIKWDNLTSAIGTAINGLFEFAHKFLTNINWGEKATQLANRINELIEIIDWDSVGTTVNDFVQALLDGAIAFFDAIDWKEVGNAIYEILAKIEWGNIFKKVGQLVWSAIKAMFQTLWQLTPNNEEEYLSGKKGGYVYPFADGGIPDQGSLFIAGEAGPELVGQVGNHSSVINANQFAEGMAYANDGVINAILSIGEAIVSAVNNVEVNPQLDGMSLARGLSPYSKRVEALAGTSLVR